MNISKAMMTLATVAGALLMPAAANAQAFGVEMGRPVSAYGGRPSSSGTKLQYDITVPQPNGEFEFYTAWATPQTGICKVTGFGKDHTNDSYGFSTKAAFKKLGVALVQKYGVSKDYDFIKHDPVWNEPDEWNWAVFKEERRLAAFWGREHGSRLPPSIDGISLTVKAVRSSAAYIVLSYEFANIAECVAIRDRRDESGL